VIEPTIVPATPEEERDFTDRLIAFNAAKAGPEDVVRVRLALKDKDGVLRGGLSAARSWGTFLIDVLWVDDELRGQGFGSQLLAEAEKQALQLECTSVKLETFSFQAQGFYERHGYCLVGRIENWPPGGHLSQMVKVLPG
jgi:ribosomal protein S18 acetylase RimI-like enzyme